MRQLPRTSYPMGPSPTRMPSRTPRSASPHNSPEKGAVVTEKYKRLTRDELEAIAGEPLPERAAMSLINANVAAPINAALALNVLSDNSVAYANAQQTGDITQST